MKKILTAVYVFILAMVFVAVSASAAKADDVYNFYFQKGSAPASVVQGGGGAAPSPTTVVKDGEVVTQVAPQAVTTQEAQSVAAPSVPKTESKDFVKPWQFTFGTASVPVGNGAGQNIMFGGWGAAGEHNISKYFGIGMGVTYADRYSDRNNSNNYYVSNTKDYNRDNPWDYQLYGTLTPVHLSLFGHDLFEAGLTAGVTTYSKNSRVTTNEYMKDLSNIAEDKRLVGFWGIRLAANINETFAIAVDGKMPSGSNIGIGQLSARVRF